MFLKPKYFSTKVTPQVLKFFRKRSFLIIPEVDLIALIIHRTKNSAFNRFVYGSRLWFFPELTLGQNGPKNSRIKIKYLVVKMMNFCLTFHVRCGPARFIEPWLSSAKHHLFRIIRVTSNNFRRLESYLKWNWDPTRVDSEFGGHRHE